MAETETHCDVIVIGAGIAGASVAAELSANQDVVLLERESQPGYHTTGRSAATFTCAYGPALIRGLTRASEAFFRGTGRNDAPAQPLLTPRGVLFVARSDQLASVDALQAEIGDAVKSVSPQSLQRMLPLLRNGYAAAGLYDETAADIDVNGAHQFFLRKLRANGGAIHTNCEVHALGRAGDDWVVSTKDQEFRAPDIVNAAGAWVDQIATMAGVAPLGIAPKRRTALLIPPPADLNPDSWKMCVDIDEQFYLKPDAGKLLISPADETLSPPCDAQPDEMDVAVCVDRIERAFDIRVRRIEHKWAGLRSFLPDGCPVAGYDPDAPGFFWLAGQGGYGIQTAPALARAAAALVRRTAIPQDIQDEGVDAPALAMTRGPVAE